MLNETTRRAIEQAADAIEADPAALTVLAGLQTGERQEAIQTIAGVLRGFLALSPDVQRAILSGDTAAVIAMFTRADLDELAAGLPDPSELLKDFPDESWIAEALRPDALELEDLSDTCPMCGSKRPA